MRIRSIAVRSFQALTLGFTTCVLAGCGESAAEDPYQKMEMIDPATAGAARQSTEVDPVLEEERRANSGFSLTAKEKVQDKKTQGAAARESSKGGDSTR